MAFFDSDGFAPYTPINDAVPGLPPVGVASGRVRCACGNLLPSSVPSAGDIGRLFRIPSNARIQQLFIEMDDQGGATTTVDVGVYVASDDTVVDLDLYGDALDGATAFSRADIRHDTLNHNTMGQRIWEDLGLSDDPNLIYTIAATWLVVATGIAGDISYSCFFTID